MSETSNLHPELLSYLNISGPRGKELTHDPTQWTVTKDILPKHQQQQRKRSSCCCRMFRCLMLLVIVGLSLAIAMYHYRREVWDIYSVQLEAKMREFDSLKWAAIQLQQFQQQQQQQRH